jgi:CubicO group peptidase (beta-lactamase class C family)
VAALSLALVAATACSGRGDVASPSAPSTSVASTTTTSSTPMTTSSTPTTPTTDHSTPTSSASASTTVAARSYDFSAISPIVQQFVDDRGLDGAGLVIVDERDGIVDEEYWGEFSADRISLIASSSKMLTAGVLMSLADQGLLDVDAPVADAVAWGAGNPEITPVQLLSNSSGLVGLLPDMLYEPYACQMSAAGTLQECAATIFTTTADDADVVAPDTEFRYGGAQWQVAAAVAEAASGKSWQQLIDETYVEPCGVDSLAFNNQWTQFGHLAAWYPSEFAGDPGTLVPTLNPNAEGGAYITAPDYARLLLMHLRGGRCGDTQVISRDAIDRMHTDRITGAYGGLGGTKGYGLGWLVDHEAGRIIDAGAYGSVPWLDLEQGYGAYLVVESSIADGDALASMLYEPVAEAIAASR